LESLNVVERVSGSRKIAGGLLDRKSAVRDILCVCVCVYRFGREMAYLVV